MNNCVLYRKLFDCDIDEELQASSKVFPTMEYRSQIPENSLVIGRYSVLPYYRELEVDLRSKGSYLLNNYDQHAYVANISNWYNDLKDYTPKTHFTWYDLKEGKYVVKGQTNSRKSLWATHMFANNIYELHGVINRCLDDALLSDQGVVVREFVPLKTFDYGINGLPVTEEYRTFWLDKNFVAGAYYWSEHPDYETPIPNDGIRFAQKIADIVSENIRFFVIDIAKTANDEWIVIELNDGQMSGLSCIDVDEFYLKLKFYIDNQ
jgi:hypothetical protein